MHLELPNDLVSAITQIQTTLADVKHELAAINARLNSKNAPPIFPRREYSVDEIAEILGKSSYTVREWCRLGHINATKRAERRGAAALWSISAEELDRYNNEGLLPIDPSRNSVD